MRSDYTPNPPQQPALLNTCLLGRGISCGLSVATNADGSITLKAGTALLPSGLVLHLTQHVFRSYIREPKADYFADTHPNTKINVWQLTTAPFDRATMDSLVPQSVDDEPKQHFLTDKILAVYSNEKGADSATFLLIRAVDLVRLTGIETDVRRLSEPEKGNRAQSIFAKPRTAVYFPPEHIEAAQFIYQQLPTLSLPRFGYKTLALVNKTHAWDFDNNDPTKPDKLDNLQNPFEQIKPATPPAPSTVFNTIFFEYKAILDDGIEEFKLALRVLHTQFGELLSGQKQSYAGSNTKKSPCSEPVQDSYAPDREVLCRKWNAFKEEGEHLYYIQYFYDWLADLHKAYDELRHALTDFAANCLCNDPMTDATAGHLLLLGPVMTETDNFGPLIFRDYFQEPYHQNHNEEQLRAIKCMHWRLLMMIWTFDLPGLHLEHKVLINGGYVDKAEEYKDSTDHWEKTAFKKKTDGEPELDKNKQFVFDPNKLPLRITPSRAFGQPMGHQAIPYYYPIDGDSPYSVHRFWDFETTKTRRIDRHLSYNVHRGSDSYSDRQEVLFPLAYNLRELPFLRLEGHIGKTVTINQQQNALPPLVTFNGIDEIIKKYNLCLEVLLVDISNGEALKISEFLSKINTNKLFGLEHQNGGYAGQTLVLFYVSVGEDIELNECRKDETDEIAANTIVADFTLPYLFSTLK